MKFKINQDHFSNGLQQVLNVVGSRATMPILSNVLIEAEEGHISLTTTNLDLGIRCRIKADVSEPGGITLPVRKLATIIRELPQNEVFIETGDNNQAKITSGGSLFKIMGISTEEFPPLPSFENRHVFELSQAEIVSMLKSVSYGQSNDENRYILNGVYFNFADEKLTLVATDGRRLALTALDTEISEDNAGSLILPAKTVAELERLMGKGEKVKIAFNDRQAAFEIGIDDAGDTGLVDHLYLVSKIVEGNYPNYRQVIPKETEHRVKIERELMLECVHRAALVTSDKSNSVKLKVSKNLLEISGSSSEYGESHESMAIAYDGPEVQVAFNPQFLMEPLKALTKDEVFFEFKDELSPGLFKTLDNFICVIMPLRLN
ncbi:MULTISPECIES: DNA polymerase III subunit beta [unclassified Lentimonas]|uniref:DNA polymerase III subunit beta n=1 Tax=unclassified Lentimonas TaxID=2630993 RepID=UPI001326DC77|nr:MULTISPECIES: DNA polymerase III subunit beta [unclassified Lentimonas]CAA6676390.1 DNA polymerase III beta subunit (EC [Lentimonas sp. CC4]CAA6685229.1 DNA polymerase III beta subunit (EC [Lentimonas sp. CC6]CAA6693418.1 DNA polymerase III beta subunit (EC [Lentimonas sp. CC19]CAA6696472.1 DNA polymerase III beta subunit (EC [Lentimonas sp. CC10]CAA7072375.1 DNA polymerase III beta subunit (EC [Lentimonas sp. CC11]